MSGYPSGFTLRVQRNRFATQLVKAFLADDFANLHDWPRERSPAGCVPHTRDLSAGAACTDAQANGWFAVIWDGLLHV